MVIGVIGLERKTYFIHISEGYLASSPEICPNV